jgi:hypothetical protein
MSQVICQHEAVKICLYFPAVTSFIDPLDLGINTVYL